MRNTITKLIQDENTTFLKKKAGKTSNPNWRFGFTSASWLLWLLHVWLVAYQAAFVFSLIWRYH